MNFVIKRTNQGGGYVAAPGSKNSYTRSLDKAQRYATRADAERDRCPENETIIHVRELL